MTWLAAITTGAGVGLVFYGGLWWTVRQLTAGRCAMWFAVSGVARVTLAGLAFYALAREGIELAAAGLLGLWLMRRYLLHELGDWPGG